MFTVAVVMALTCAALTGVGTHAALGPAMRSRGVTPWTLVDSLAAAPLVYVGAGLLGGGVMVLVWAVGVSAIYFVPIATAAGIVLVGALVMLLGALELRKLF